ncbi:MAG: HlyD family efflux transporter periplasmic adaptor subunit [Gemmataceae bacterium]|nr:HlyD family efflux transporter periplasmic adaptor subunit [Gemmataceae bacterium]
MKGAFWLLGAILLVGSIVGVRLATDPQVSGHVKKANEAAAEGAPTKVICWGNFDVESGIAQLFPKQFGEVKFIAAENTKVEAGALLLSIDDELFKLKGAEAKADIDAAMELVAEAKQLPKLYELQAEQQQASINAIDEEVKKTTSDREVRLNSLEKTQPLYKTYSEHYRAALAQLAEKRKAEEAKLKQINLQDPNIKIRQAEADLSAKKVRLKQAEEMVKHCHIFAPSDGHVLRVHVRKGEVLGPAPRAPAVEFLPKAPIIVRAEVLQEWGRLIKVDQPVEIRDDTYNGPKWDGKVKTISRWYANARSIIIEPFRYNDVRTLEIIIEVTSKVGEQKFIGQRVRAEVKTIP